MLKKYFGVLFVMSMLFLFAEKPVFKVPDIIVEAEREEFWFDGKEIKFVLKFDHFFFGTQTYRVYETIEYDRMIGKSIVHFGYYYFNRVGIDDTYKTGASYAFLLDGSFMYFQTTATYENFKKTQKYELDAGYEKGKIKTGDGEYIDFKEREEFVIGKRETGHWFILIYNIFGLTRKIEQGYTVGLNLILLNDGITFDYNRDTRGDLRDLRMKRKR